MATSARTRRAAKIFAGAATGLAGIAPIARGRRATAIGPRGSLAASANSPVVPRIATAAGIAAPRKDFGKDFDKDFGDRPPRGESKPWQKREEGFERPARRDGERKSDRPKFDKPRYDRPRDDRDGRIARSIASLATNSIVRVRIVRNSAARRFERNGESGGRRDDRRPRPEGRRDWQEHPRSEGRFADRPRRDNEDDSKIFAKRPAFGGRGAYRERKPDFDRRPRARGAEAEEGRRAHRKVLARAGLASRRDAEEMVTQGRVTVNGRVINSPALDITANDVVAVDGKPLPPRERTRLFLYHKPSGLMTTHADPEGRPTVFDNLPEGLPRLISIGRLDFNTEGLAAAHQ